MVCPKNTYPFPTSQLSICFYERGITRCQWSVVSGRCVLSEHSSMRMEFSHFLLAHFPFTYFPLIIVLTYYENYFRKKFSYCEGGRKPMNVYPEKTAWHPVFRILFYSECKSIILSINNDCLTLFQFACYYQFGNLIRNILGDNPLNGPCTK